jgi:hypothetical protein
MWLKRGIMLKYIKIGLILTLLFLYCKHIEQYRITIDKYDVAIRLFTDDFGFKYAFRPVCYGQISNRGVDTVYRVRIYVTFYPYIEGATDHSYYINKPVIKKIQPGDSVDFVVEGSKAYCLPDYEIPNIIVLSIKYTFEKH